MGPRRDTGDCQSPPALSAREITKVFPGVVANRSTDFEVRTGEVHALLGENGSGKTTLCKIMSGFYRPDAGRTSISGRLVQLRSPSEAHQLGVFMVHQHFSLVDRFTVAENVMLGWGASSRLRFDRRAAERTVAEAAERFHMDVDPRARTWQLSVGERQRVEILKTLIRGARVLLLDEPTTVLTPQETKQLFVSIRQMASEGGAVVFVSHKLREVLEVCDRLTILRQGETVGTIDLQTADGKALDTRSLATMMIGRDVEFPRRDQANDLGHHPVVLSVNAISADNDYGRPAITEVTFNVRAGEILGIAGVAGNGQLQLAEALAGLRPLSAGSIVIDGEPLPSGDPRQNIARGVSYVPDDRFGRGLVPTLRVRDNVILKSYRLPAFSPRWVLRASRIRKETESLITRFEVKGTPETLVRQLSGGNAQKVLVGRELASNPRVLIICAPTRGLDVGAMSTVRSLLFEAAAANTAIVLISEDLEELMEVSDRLAVISAGRIVGMLESKNAEVEKIGLMMMGEVLVS